MKIVHIASELAPIAKVGGLGDVIHGLSKQQHQNGNDVEIFLPKYDIIKYRSVENLSLDLPDLWSYEDTFRYHNSVWSGIVDGLKVFFIEPHHNQYYFNRGLIYGSLNDVERFLYFCRAVCEYLYTQKKQPDIIHLHDWPTATVAPLIKHIYEDLGFQYGALVLTIHNIEHQGRCHPRNLTRIGLRGEDFRTIEKMQDPDDPSLINLLKGGIIYSDSITTVSPKYAEEIKTPEYGFGLDTTIGEYEHKLSGILNGIEPEYWNPSKDSFLTIKYPSNPTFVERILKHKEENRHELCKKLGIEPCQGPLITCISRIAKQKSPKLIHRALQYTLQKEGNFVLLGAPHDLHTEKEFLHIKDHYKSNPHVHIELRYDEELAHLLYAAADAIVIPSLYEPCGLTQMISMRYGTVPIARKTGGLADTVFDIDDESVPAKLRTGFTFQSPDESSVDKVLDRVFDCYLNEKNKWMILVQNGLSLDTSWKNSANQYQAQYSSAIKFHKRSARRLPVH